MDTAAVVTVILLVGTFSGGHMTPFIFLFLVFLTVVLLIYFVLPGICEFWRKYLLRAKATEQRLAILELLKTFNMIYQEIENVAKGKGVILYFISLFSWGIEIGSVAVLNGILKEGELSTMISGYLISEMNGHPTVELQQFVFTSIILLTIFYFVFKIITILYEKKVHE